MKITKQEIILLIFLLGSYLILDYLYKILAEAIEPKSAFIVFTSFYGFALLVFFWLYRKGTINFSFLNHEESYRQKASKLGIFVSSIIILIGFLGYLLPHDNTMIICNILVILAAVAILIWHVKHRN